MFPENTTHICKKNAEFQIENKMPNLLAIKKNRLYK